MPPKSGRSDVSSYSYIQMPLPQCQRVVRSDMSFDSDELTTPVTRRPRSDVSSNSGPEIFSIGPMRSDVSLDEDEVR